MASARKKKDDNNVKTLRELGALPQNKFCFDCGQRGPTYVNVTIGSLVCTKCSGMLRGLTPPHRVKSISMATFTPEEIDSLREKGNDHCRRTWLGLYEGTLPSQSDEQGVRDFMVEKYERKRYYLEMSMVRSETNQTHINVFTKTQINGLSRTNINVNITGNNGISQQNGFNRQNGTSRSRPEVKNSSNNNLSSNFTVDFDNADIFTNTSANSSKSLSASGSSQNNFANFDSNPVFDNSARTNKGISHNTPWLLQPAHPQMNDSNSTVNGTQPKVNVVPLKINNVQFTSPSNMDDVHPPVHGVAQFNTGQDKYAALKDLDEEIKSQSQSHTDIWTNSNGGSTGSLYSSPTPTIGSTYGSPSSQGSLFGSPRQGYFMTAFNTESNLTVNSNPFNASAWSTTNTNNINGFANFNGNHFPNGTNAQASQSIFNPFKQEQNANGFANFQAVFPQNSLMDNGGSDAWGANPFKVSAGTDLAQSSNPFL